MREKDKIKTEDKIFDSAMKEFLEKGFNGARMQAIADEAGINKALLHYYFKSKEVLYKEVFKKVFVEFFNAIIIKTDQSLSFQAYLKEFIANYIDKLAHRQEMLKFMIWELENEAKSITEYIHNNVDAQKTASNFPILKKIDEAKRAGEIREIDSFHLFLNIVSMCIYPFLAQNIVKNIVKNIDLNNASFRQQRKDAIFDLVWHSIKKEEIDAVL